MKAKDYFCIFAAGTFALILVCFAPAWAREHWQDITLVLTAVSTVTAVVVAVEAGKISQKVEEEQK